jgi:hypothetical protein
MYRGNARKMLNLDFEWIHSVRRHAEPDRTRARHIGITVPYGSVATGLCWRAEHGTKRDE